MERRRLVKIALTIVGLVGLAAAAILVNLALLAYAQPSDDPVGRLSPRVAVDSPPPAVTTRPAQDDDRHGDSDEHDRDADD